MKTCSKCKVEKDESEFCKNKNIKDGLNPECRECKSKYQHLRYLSIRKSSRPYKPQNVSDQERRQRKLKTLNHNKERHKRWLQIDKNAKNEKERQRIKQLKEIQDLKPRYLRFHLKRKGFTLDQINENPSLLEIQKALILIKRHAKQHRQSK